MSTPSAPDQIIRVAIRRGAQQHSRLAGLACEACLSNRLYRLVSRAAPGCLEAAENGDEAWFNRQTLPPPTNPLITSTTGV